MGFPIVLGTKSISSHIIPLAEPIEEFSVDGDILTPRLLNKQPLFTVATSEQHLQATVSLSYYELMRDDFREHTVAEIRVKISPLSLLSFDYRDTVHRIHLPETTLQSENNNAQQVPLTAILSASRKFLACLIPYPGSQSSIVVIFQLRRPRSDSATTDAPPLPSYIPLPHTPQPIPVATNPRTIPLISNALTICHLSILEVGSLLLIACHDGRLQVARIRPVEVLGTLMVNEFPVRHIEAIPIGEDGNGRISLCLKDGTVLVLNTSLVSKEALKDGNHQGNTAHNISFDIGQDHYVLSVSERFHIKGQVAVVSKWISAEYLALLSCQSRKSIVRVVSMDDKERCVGFSHAEITLDHILEDAHTCFDIDQPMIEQEKEPVSVYVTVGLEYDWFSDCLTVSSVLLPSQEPIDSLLQCIEPIPFCYIWNWRSNTQGITLVPSARYRPRRFTANSAFVNGFHFACDENNHRRLVHIFGNCLVQKELFEYGCLSPPTDFSWNVRRPASLLLTNLSVCCPLVRTMDLNDEFEVSWEEFSLPSAYVSNWGAPVLGVIGGRLGRSVAVASSHGVCTLDVSIDSLESRIPRWHYFGNLVEEGCFKILAMEWWEGGNVKSGSSRNILLDDILVAVIEVKADESTCRYLSCWSQGRVDKSLQLLRQKNIPLDGEMPWGIPLQDTSSAAPTIDVFSMPDLNFRKAVFLVSDDSALTPFQIFQVELLPELASFHASYSERRSYVALGRRAAHGEIGSRATMFLASASMAFELGSQLDVKGFDPYVATLGVIRRSGGKLDAIAVSNSAVIAVGEVLLFERLSFLPDVSAFWLTDVVGDPNFHIVNDEGSGCVLWTIQLSSGDLFSWSLTVPLDTRRLETISEPSQLSQSPIRESDMASSLGIPHHVHKRSLALGIVCRIGKSSTWLQLSSFTTTKEFDMGAVPDSGCRLRTYQSSKHLHRKLFENHLDGDTIHDFIEYDVFYQSEILLAPPLSLVSMVLMSLENASFDVSKYFKVFLFRKHKESFFMSLQLFILRVIESTASKFKSQGDTGQQGGMISAVVHSLEMCTSPLQFSTLMLEVGRQLEPSCVPYLFPLRTVSDMYPRTIENIYYDCLSGGSISIASSALPLLEKQYSTRTKCADIFRDCLVAIALPATDNCTYIDSVEQKLLLSDIFRFGLKLDGCFTEPNSFNTSKDSEQDDDDHSMTTLSSYSIFCGLSRLFRKDRSKEELAILSAASSFIVTGFESELPVNTGKMITSTFGKSYGNGHADFITRNLHSTNQFCTVRSLCATFITSLTFSLEETSSWRKMAGIAMLLTGDNFDGLQIASKEDLLGLVERYRACTFCDLISNKFQAHNLDEFFMQRIIDCCEQIGPNEASIILDLILVLLANDNDAIDFYAEVPALILTAIVVGFVANRNDYVDYSDSQRQHYVWKSYRKAILMLPDTLM